jgi:hypothetical protein
MMSQTLLLVVALAAAASAATAQNNAQPQRPTENEPVPVALALQDLTDAYSAGPTADEISARVTYRGLDRTEGLSQAYTVRIDPDPETRSLRRVLLELAPLRAYFGDGRMVVVSTSAPDKYYEAAFHPPLTNATVQQLLPPVPAPQLVIASGLRAQDAADLTPYTPAVSFSSAIASTRVRPPVMLISGTSNTGPVTLMVDVQSGRLSRFTADIGGPQPTSIELSCRAAEPGDPAQWSPDISGRQRVADLSELRPSPPLPLKAGDRAPDLSFSHPEQRVWSLLETMGANPDRPVALVLWRWSREAQRADAAMKAAQGASRVISRLGGEFPRHAGPGFAAVTLELADYTGVLLAELGRRWKSGAADAPELYWSPSAARSIDRFAPEADAVLVVIAPDRRILSIIPLDGRREEDLLLQVRSLLTPLDGP